MLDRAEVIDANFIELVNAKRFPAAKSLTTIAQANLSHNDIIELFESQLLSRHLDLKSRQLKLANKSFYTIGSSGHEGNAAISRAFTLKDMAFLHYRSAAFMLERARFNPDIDMVYDIILSMVASSDDPVCSGRHKVFGHQALNVPPQTSTIASHLPKAVGTAISIARAEELKIASALAADSVILCSFGDASLNHSTAKGAINTAQWVTHQGYPVPIVFICEDNEVGISVPTPSDWVQAVMQDAPNIHYLPADGLNVCDVYATAKHAETIARSKRKPVFLHIKTVRLLGHAGSDIESQYLPQAQIEAKEYNDPLLHTSRILYQEKILTPRQIIDRYQQARLRVDRASEKAVAKPKLSSAKAVLSSLLPLTSKAKLPKIPPAAKRQVAFGNAFAHMQQKRNLSQLINMALTDLMLQYDNMLLFGEDVARKGGVYRVTADLVKRFGQRRVFDTLLDEQTILGTAIGMAMNGFIPVAEIQFLAYFHNACDQIRGEAASLAFFSNGQYSNPMIVRIPGLAYQKGFGGHFHNDNTLAVFRDIPGVILVCPSNGLDAVKLLRTCMQLAYKERRIILFIEPIALYMTRDLHDYGDALWHFTYPELTETITFGEIGVQGTGKDLAIISYGNGYYLASQAEKLLQQHYNLSIKLIDLRWLNPLNEEAILQATRDVKHVLIVDECRHSGSISEALMTMYLEKCPKLPKIKRITAEDCFIPLGTSWQYVLPSKENIIDAALDLVGKEKQKRRAC